MPSPVSEGTPLLHSKRQSKSFRNIMSSSNAASPSSPVPETHTASTGNNATTTLPRRTLVRNDSTSSTTVASANYGRLSVRGMNFRIPTNQGAHDHALDQNGQDSWRYKTVKFIHSSKIQIALMVLLFCDVIILFIELLFLAQYPMCNLTERDAISCCPSNEKDTAAAANEVDLRRNLIAMAAAPAPWHRSLSEASGEEVSCSANLEAFPQYPATCDPEKWHVVHTIETVLFAATIFILSVFMLELTVSMIALTPQIFFRQFFFLLDFVIITVSLVLEIVFHVIGDEAIYEYVAGFLVVGRVWRFIRIGHGIVEITNEMAHREYADLLTYTDDLQEQLRQHNISFPSMDEKLRKAAEAKDKILDEVKRRHNDKYGKASSHVEDGRVVAMSEAETSDE
ncbi:hypothetical protein MPSEU_000112900 [Mayamaea pseudoterrestris]|nr:hypothetical protein MPSEU_000112900 [Mayamaea pseudoterrestris]